MTNVGFTGTRAGMTAAQKAMVVGLLVRENAVVAHHGGCVGADIDFDDICYNFRSQGSIPRNIVTVVHPSDVKSARGRWHYTPHVMSEFPPLERNHHIVDVSSVMIATPVGMDEVLRSGTWACIRYARSIGKPMYVVYPDGRVERENVKNEKVDC